jgi:hypothetical protein
MKLTYNHVPFGILFTGGMIGLMIHVQAKISYSVSKINQNTKAFETITSKTNQQITADTQSIIAMCNSKGVKLNLSKEYSSGLTYASLPRGGYILTEGNYKGEPSNVTEIELNNYGKRVVIIPGQKIINCGQVDLEALKQKARPFGQIRDLKASFEITKVDGKTTTTFLKVERRMDKMVYLAFVSGQPVVIANSFMGSQDVSGYTNINDVKLAWFDLSQ